MDIEVIIPIHDMGAVEQLSVVPGHEKKGIKSFIATINAKAFIDRADQLDAFRKINPREPRRSSLAWKAMRDTLDEYPDQFFYRNKGLLMLADDFIIDNRNKSITIVLNNRQLHGIADGGHTFDVLKAYFEENMEEDIDKKVYLKVEFLVGFDTKEKVVEIVEGRNTALQVQQMTLDNMLNKFDDIKRVMRGKSYEGQISYSEYETDDEGKKKKIKVTDLIGYMVTYNIDKFPLEGDSVPIAAYSSKKKSLEIFGEMYDEGVVAKYAQILPDIVELWDNIYINMPKLIGKKLDTIKKGDDTTIVKNRKIYLPYIDEKIDYAIPAGWIYPLFATFRNLLIEKNDILEFSQNPSEFLEENLQDIAQPYRKALRDINYEPQTFAKSRLVWINLDLEMDKLLRSKK